MIEFLQPIFKRFSDERAKAVTARKKVLALVRKGATAGTLKETESDALFAAMQEAGVPPEHVEADAAFVAEFLAIEQAANDLPKRQSASEAATAAMTTFEAERGRIMDDLNAKGMSLYAASMEAANQLVESRDAAKLVRQMQKRRPDLVGHPEKYKACVLLADECDPPTRDKFPTSLSPVLIGHVHHARMAKMLENPTGRNHLRPGEDFVEVEVSKMRMMAERKVAEDRERQREAAIAASGKRLIRINPDKLIGGWDVDDYDFHAAPDQDPAEFAALLAVLQRRKADDAEQQKRDAQRNERNVNHNAEWAASVKQPA